MSIEGTSNLRCLRQFLLQVPPKLQAYCIVEIIWYFLEDVVVEAKVPELLLRQRKIRVTLRELIVHLTSNITPRVARLAQQICLLFRLARLVDCANDYGLDGLRLVRLVLNQIVGLLRRTLLQILNGFVIFYIRRIADLVSALNEFCLGNV